MDVCIHLAQHFDIEVRANALLGFGHLARRFKGLDLKRASSCIAAALLDPDPSVRQSAEWAATDILLYRGTVISTFQSPGAVETPAFECIRSRLRASQN